MNGPISLDERGTLATLDGMRAAMLARTVEWADVNSGSRNLDGLALMAGLLADHFAPLAEVVLRDPVDVTAVDAGGMVRPLAHGRNLHAVCRPDAPLQVLLTGHMDTVFGADHAFQTCRWLDADTLNGPGTADMKGGIAVMLAALTAFEESNRALVVHLGELAERRGATTGQIALAWLLAQHAWIVPIPGTRRASRVQENVGAAALALSADDIADLDALAARVGVRGDRYNASQMAYVDR